MSTIKWTLAGWFLCGAVLLCASPAQSREKHGIKPQPKLNIRLEGKTGRIVVSWDGMGVLKQATSRDGQFRPVRHGAGRYI
ncbi:MAG TPA: hypothetical protein VNT26_11180, partial [Candidatus Sulfotelmatobacter sp.]|nr:hypothetical protein [Candidatus Sulfotelmatobacter sp.]